ncbi:type VII secretion system-associated protein [Streptomyces sp. NBC_01433]|uniref:type VII secretion system-associated protein n=1 Tax=Streptomyces sp. NBC_01433 TaxID=2903864 RepID=UPI00225940AA|nr:type VII secretion system-associated protein [Streptomyces sp. NBC_01433]MCX4679468.1 type VII secretion system-associated protein [Streptomyces sp. NBC_01433]
MRPGERQEGRNEAPFALPDGFGPTAGPESPVSGNTAATDTSGIPEAVRAAARRAPGHWIGMVDPEWTEVRTPPEWAVLGEWQSDESGSVGEYRANPAYRPSARVLGWPEPTDPVDAAAQRAATGYGSVEAALAALAEADITVVRGPDGGPLTATGRDGAPVVLLFTSPAHEFMSAALHHDTLSARELARSLRGPGTMLMVNAGAAAPLLVPADSLLGARAGTADPAGAPATTPSADRTDSSSDELWPHTTGRTP